MMNDKNSKLALKEAREQDKLDEFIKEHEEDGPGDSDKLEKALDRISRGDKNISKAAQKKR